MKEYTPKFGEIVWVNLEPIKGHEQGGTRPSLVLSNTKYNDKTGMVLVAPITSRPKGYAGEIPLPDGLKTTGIILSDHIRNLDWMERPVQSSGDIVDRETVKEVMERLNTLCDE